MSREIKFRAWDKEAEKMVKVIALVKSFWGNCEQDYTSTCGIAEDETELGTEITNSYNYDLMQYTGIKDANDKEIYEGDIVQVFDALKENCGMYKILVDCNLYEEFGKSYEIVGNIYDNPELSYIK